MTEPIRYTLIPEHGLVYVAVSGHLQARHILAYLGELGTDPDFDPAWDVLVDLGKVDHYDVDSAEMRAVVAANAEFSKDAPRTKCVLVSSADFVFGMLRMYQTLTRGYGQMIAQNHYTDRQKYDVIHYIRESFLKNFNEDYYTAVTPEYLDSLPESLAAAEQ